MSRAATNPLTAFLRRRRDRTMLMSLDDRMLADIGVPRSEIDRYIAGGRPR